LNDIWIDEDGNLTEMPEPSSPPLVLFEIFPDGTEREVDINDII